MKALSVRYMFIAVLLLFVCALSAQGDGEPKKKGKFETVEMQVEGVCGMCQSRIELAVYDMKGVQSVKWDLETSKLTAVVRRGKVTKQQIADALAAAGHSSDLAKAAPDAYKNLPECCKYADGVKKHGSGHHRR